jgi:hypothetical protein
MKITELRLISLSRHSDEPLFLYGLSDRKPTAGSVIYCRDYGRMCCIQNVSEQMLPPLENWHTIEMTNNPNLNLPQFPQAIVKQYFEGGKQLKTVNVRI